MRGRHPLAVWFLAACVLSGISSLVIDSEPPTLQRNLPAWVLFAWSWSLILGAGVALAGVVIRPAWGILVERLGLSVLAPAVLGYATAVVVVNGQRAVFAGAIVGSLGVACIARVVRITIDVRRVTDGASE
jgi:hypothetical protein